MADKIRSTLEKFIPDLLALQKRNVFTSEEVKQILQERERLEYLLQRKTISLKDFLKVVDYEYQLERKRMQRCAELKIKKMGDRDYTIVIKRILNLWARIMNKYRYSVPLWKQYLAFCFQIQSKKHFRKVATHSLRFNASSIDLWIIAALYEFETQSNPFKARQIFYQALKINPQSKQLWAEYLRFELNFLVMVMQRQNALQPQQPQDQKDFIRFDQEQQKNGIEQDQFIRETGFYISIVQTIIKLAIERHNSSDMYRLLLTVLTDFSFIQQSLLQSIANQGIQLLLSQNDLLTQEQLDNETSNYLYFLQCTNADLFQDLATRISGYTIKNQFQGYLISQLIKKIAQDQDIHNLFLLFKVNNNPLALFEESIFQSCLSACENHPKEQKALSSLLCSGQLSIENRVRLYKYFNSLDEEVQKIMMVDFEKIEKSLFKVKKDELLNLLQSLMNIEGFGKRAFQIAKKQLMNEKHLFSKFLESYFEKIEDAEEKKQALEWLVKQNQYCPLKYHLMNGKINFQRMSQLMLWFADQEDAWKFGSEWTKSNCPEKLVELMSFAEKNSQIERSKLIDCLNLQ